MSIVNFNSTQYQAPGVYVEQTAASQVSVGSIAASVVGIVGPSLGYKTSTEAYAFTSSAPTITLKHSGPNLSSLVLTTTAGTVIPNTGTGSGPAPYTTTLIGTGNTSTATVTADLALTGGITQGETIYATYQYTDQNYFLPVLYTNINDITAAFGQPFDSNGNIITPLSLAAQLAFANGASQIVICPTTDTGNATESGLLAAYSAIESLNVVDIIVPLPVGLTGSIATPGNIEAIGTDIGTFLASQAALSNFAVAVIGYETTVTLGPDTIANAIANDRVIEAWPNQMNFYNPYLGTNTVVSGYYVAAALAGILAVNDPEVPLTHKAVNGFSGIPASVLATMTIPYMNQLSAAGVSVVQPSPNGGLWVQQGVTTSTTSENTLEISLVRAADAMIELIQNTVNTSGIIGSAFQTSTIATITSLVQGALNNLQDDGVIIGYNNLSVVQQGTNPVLAIVTFVYTPAYPLNYILVQFSVNTSSGTVSATTSDAGSV